MTYEELDAGLRRAWEYAADHEDGLALVVIDWLLAYLKANEDDLDELLGGE